MKIRIKTIEEMVPDLDEDYIDNSISTLNDGFLLNDGSYFHHNMVKYCGLTIEVEQNSDAIWPNPDERLYPYKVYNSKWGIYWHFNPLMYEIPKNRNGANS